MTYLRRTIAALVGGFWAGLDLLLYGRVYPRHYPVHLPAAAPSVPGSGR